MGKLSEKDEAYKIFILMQFTKELLKHSASYDVSTLERILKEKKEVEIKKRDLEKEKNELKLYQLIQRQRVVEETIPLFPKQKKHKKKTIVMRAPLPKLPQLKIPRATPHQLPLSELNIPYNQLPPELQHITPVPSKESLELGKLTPYLNDPSISTIECRGPNINITVKRGREIRKTDLVLNQEEIDEVIQAFSRAVKIPIHEGIFRVAIGRVIMTSQVSGETGTKFVITKMY